jgi:hypothetical protein
MPSDLDQALTELDGVELGFVLGALLVGAGDEPAFAAGLPAASRERCAHALAAIAALPRAERVRVTGVLAREARSVVPSGIEGVHPDQIRAALDQESPALVRRLQSAWDPDVPPAVRATTARWVAEQSEPEPEALESSTGGDPELLADVQRSVFAGLAEVPPPWHEARPHRWSRQLTLMEPAALLSLVGDGEGRRVRELGARLAREEAEGLGGAAQQLAVAQRLPARLAAALAAALLEATAADPDEARKPAPGGMLPGG